MKVNVYDRNGRCVQREAPAQWVTFDDDEYLQVNVSLFWRKDLIEAEDYIHCLASGIKFIIIK